MCNLYSLTKRPSGSATGFGRDTIGTGNLPLFPGLFPDQMTPIVRTADDGERELVMARWISPSSSKRRPRLSWGSKARPLLRRTNKCSFDHEFA
jgi:putative SOS response-associated peptidase YedK